MLSAPQESSDFKRTSYKNNKKPGYATFECVRQGDFTGKVKVGFMIEPPDVKKVKVRKNGKSGVTVTWDAKPLKRAKVSQVVATVGLQDKQGNRLGKYKKTIKNMKKNSFSFDVKKVAKKRAGKAVKMKMWFRVTTKAKAPLYRGGMHADKLYSPASGSIKTYKLPSKAA